jgi:hypothetical protein
MSQKKVEDSSNCGSNSLEEGALVTEDGPEAAGLVDQVASTVGAVGAGRC